MRPLNHLFSPFPGFLRQHALFCPRMATPRPPQTPTPPVFFRTALPDPIFFCPSTLSLKSHVTNYPNLLEFSPISLFLGRPAVSPCQPPAFPLHLKTCGEAGQPLLHSAQRGSTRIAGPERKHFSAIFQRSADLSCEAPSPAPGNTATANRVGRENTRGLTS